MAGATPAVFARALLLREELAFGGAYAPRAACWACAMNSSARSGRYPAGVAA
jgi:hypothetical protein